MRPGSSLSFDNHYLVNLKAHQVMFRVHLDAKPHDSMKRMAD
jgi:hypothetical protein